MLDGIRILDFTQNLPGPFASQRLANWGAEVVKIEPLSGESARHLGEKQQGIGLLFLANNRRKKLVALDLKAEEGKQLALRLMEQCDVVMESFRPGVMKRLGLGYEDVVLTHPNIIYASISGYGQIGKLAHYASHDLNYMALSGALAQLKDRQGIPIHSTLLWADLIGGMAAAEAILRALVQLGRQKRGVYLDLSLLQEVSQLLDTHRQIYEATGREHGPELLAGGTISYGLYQTKDDRFVALAALEPKFWAQFCIAVGKSEWIPLQFTPQSEENPIYRDLCYLFASRTWEEWLEFGMKVDCCLTPVMEVGETISYSLVDPHISPSMDQSPFRSSFQIGAHTKEVLQDWLKATAEEITQWQEKGIIQTI